MKFSMILLVLAALLGCKSLPPGPKEPSEGTRVPINNTIPEEIQEKK